MEEYAYPDGQKEWAGMKVRLVKARVKGLTSPAINYRQN